MKNLMSTNTILPEKVRKYILRVVLLLTMSLSTFTVWAQSNGRFRTDSIPKPWTEMNFIPSSHVSVRQYISQVAVKTNLLVLGTTTPNIGVEFGLNPDWTLDISTGYNPFQLKKKGVNKAGFIQSELRYWFCQRFEKHFVGLYGTYMGYNIGEVDLLTKIFEQHRYKGWGAGTGISYGYYLPIGGRWAFEFTVGVGYLYLEYDKFHCYECDEFIGRQNRHYFGLTKAGISLMFMIN